MVKPDYRKKRILPLSITAGACGLAALIGYLVADVRGTGDRFYLESSGGPVVFTHAQHQRQAGDCVLCHHELVLGQAALCGDCHDDPDYVPGLVPHADLLDVPEHACGDCHRLAEPAAARSCRACHGQAVAEGEGAPSCADCHDDPALTREAFGHGELLAVADHTCDGCHRIRPVGEAYHAQCSECHLAVAAARFADPQGQVLCAACHLK